MVAATLKLKIKATSSKQSWFSHTVDSGSSFYFYSPLQTELELETGTEVLQLEQWVLYFASGWSAQCQLSLSSFLILAQTLFTWNSSSVSPLHPLLKVSVKWSLAPMLTHLTMAVGDSFSIDQN